MIGRYTLPDMGRVWSEAHKYELWCQVETLVMEAHAAAGVVPTDALEAVRKAPAPTPEAVAEIEAVTQHDVIAFLSAWADNTEPREAAAFVHFGMTSSDLLDTALALQLVEATDLLLTKADRLVAVLRDHALAHRDTLRVGRTHGIHGEPDVWGHRVADFAFGVARSRDRIRRAREAVGVMAISGAVGTYSNIDPAVESYVAEKLNLKAADVSTQVVLRDGISEWVGAFGKGQKGSSAMPHKKNPIISERIAGMARIVRGQIVPVMEGIPLWHERDISHSSTERIALPDASIALDYLLNLTIRLVDGLVVDKDRMLKNLESTGGLIYTSTVLLELVEMGLERDTQAYPLTQRAAMKTWETGRPFRETLREEAAEAGLEIDEKRLDEVCRPERFVTRLDGMFAKLAELK